MSIQNWKTVLCRDEGYFAASQSALSEIYVITGELNASTDHTQLLPGLDAPCTHVCKHTIPVCKAVNNNQHGQVSLMFWTLMVLPAHSLNCSTDTQLLFVKQGLLCIFSFPFAAHSLLLGEFCSEYLSNRGIYLSVVLGGWRTSDHLLFVFITKTSRDKGTGIKGGGWWWLWLWWWWWWW